MLRSYSIPFWKKFPFVRLLLPLIAGIILQWYLQTPVILIVTALASFIISLLLFLLLPISLRFKLQPLQGSIIHLVLFSFGALLCLQKDMRHNDAWYGKYYRQGDHLKVRIEEPLVEKARSYKAEGYVETVIKNGRSISCKGKLLLYFSKDSITNRLDYGDVILINKPLQSIKNSGNPGAFNYQRYAAFQQTFHNVFLKDKDWVLLNETSVKKTSYLKQFIFSARKYILSVLRKTIDAGKDELGIAEALLIGYTHDLDKDLVQAYSNTGVVHIIAISGMHLGLIYVLLLWIFARLPFIKRSRLLQAVLILSCLWLFSLLTGAAASVLRSAVMFTFITVGKSLSRESAIYNSLAASAFLMLCYDPYYLWDVGFQLSYLAVAGISLFQKPAYVLFFIKNKWIDKVWKLAAISIAAQVLTFPVCIYYFHQFPNLFLFTNIIAVPLSGIILYVEIILVAFSWIPLAGEWMGKLAGSMLWLMNRIILWVNKLPFAVWDNIPATVLSTWSLYAVVICLGAWLLNRNKKLLQSGSVFLLFLKALFAYNSWQVAQQQKLIVYNVPRHQAIDLISGTNFKFVGDSVLRKDAMLQNFHLKPGRIAMQLDKESDTINAIFHQKIFYRFGNKRIIIIDEPISISPLPHKIDIDLMIISKNPGLSISALARTFNCKLFVFDASNSFYRIEKWQKECNSLHLESYSIPEEGAFIYNIGI